MGVGAEADVFPVGDRVQIQRLPGQRSCGCDVHGEKHQRPPADRFPLLQDGAFPRDAGEWEVAVIAIVQLCDELHAASGTRAPSPSHDRLFDELITLCYFCDV